MVLDPHRTPLLADAIRTVVNPNDIVVDIGCGIGILSFLAAQAGAKKVVAIDCDRGALEAAKFFAHQLGLDQTIQFKSGLSSTQKLPEKADVLLCEIIGSLGFEENILTTLLDARKRFLKPKGIIIPAVIELWGALVEDNAQFEGWGDVAGLDLRHATAPLSDWKAITIAPHHLLSSAEKLTHIDTRTFSSSELSVTHSFKPTQSGKLGGIAVWPKVFWTQEIITDASPFMPTTHWKQGYLPLAPRLITPKQTTQFQLHIHPNPACPTEQTEVLWKVE